MTRSFSFGRPGFAVLACVAILSPGHLRADEPHARQIFHDMSAYLGSLESFAFDYDSTLDIVTTEDQKLAISSSGHVALDRSGNFHSVRRGGFATIELGFDGQAMTVMNRDVGVFARIEAPGSVDDLIETLRETYGRPVPAADLLTSDVEGALAPLFTDIKDLGSGVIAGVECDHLAFRTDEVDLQIWIAQGEAPYPCRYVITNRDVVGWPEYRITVSNWQAAAEVPAMQIPASAAEVAIDAIPDLSELTGNYSVKGE
jgi:hypothetical protein